MNTKNTGEPVPEDCDQDPVYEALALDFSFLVSVKSTHFGPNKKRHEKRLAANDSCRYR